MVRVPASTSAILRSAAAAVAVVAELEERVGAVRQGASGIVAVSVVPCAGRAVDLSRPPSDSTRAAQALQPGAARSAGAAGAVVGDLGDERAPVLDDATRAARWRRRA